MAYFRRLPSGLWQATVRHPSGRRLTRSDSLKSVVREWAERVENDLRRGTFVDPQASRITLSEWWVLWRESRVVARATASKDETHWRVHVEPEFGSWPLESIRVEDVRSWVAGKVAAETGPEALATALRLLKHLLSAAVEAGRLRVNVAESVRAPRPPKHVDRILDAGEADRLLEAITVPGARRGVPRGDVRPRVADPVSRLFVRLMLEAGLRWQEAAGLHGSRVDLQRRRLRVQDVVERGRMVRGSAKSAAGERWVPLTDRLVKDLRAHLRGRDMGGLVFADRRGKPLDYRNWLRDVWNPAVRSAGLVEPLPTPHDCRHSYGSWLADAGVPPHEIMVLMGHSSLRAVERYIHASEARMDRARAALDARVTHSGGVGKGKAPSRGGGNGA